MDTLERRLFGPVLWLGWALMTQGCGEGSTGGGWVFLGVMGGGFILLIALVARYFIKASKAVRKVKPATEILDPFAWDAPPSGPQEDEGQQPDQEGQPTDPKGP